MLVFLNFEVYRLESITFRLTHEGSSLNKFEIFN